MAFPTSLRALNSRNYRLFFTGQSFSLLGNWMTLTTSAWLIYELSRDPFLVGFLPFANQIPVLLLAPLGGLLGDRLPRIRLMWWLNILCALQAATLATLTLFDAITVGRLLALVTFRGLINALEFPTRQSFIVELVDRKDDLPNAIALNSSMFNAARLVGPGIAGLTIATAGPGVSYLLDASSYLAILSALFLIRPPAHHRPAAQRKRLLTELREGVGYARRSPALMPSLVMVPLIALVGFAASTLAPVFARDLFHGDSTTLGYMFSAVGAGALVSAVTLARQPSPRACPASSPRVRLPSRLAKLESPSAPPFPGPCCAWPPPVGAPCSPWPATTPSCNPPSLTTNAAVSWASSPWAKACFPSAA